MKKLIPYLTFFLFFNINAFAQNVIVTPGGSSYQDLTYALDAINAGNHTGTITVDIVTSTFETNSATLNGSGTGAANYSSVVITTSNPAGVTVEGKLGGAAVIHLNGADNVSIDGRIGGAGRYLTIKNNGNSANTTGIWISNGSSQSDTSGAKNNVIRNCNISTNVRVDSSALNSYGILFSSSVIGINPGRNNDNNQILNNKIIRCRYGVVLHGGVSENLSDNNIIEGNLIGPGSYGPDAIGKAGIYVLFQNNCRIYKNEVQYVGGPSTLTTAGSDRIGIAIGNDSPRMFATTMTTGRNNVINGNKIHHIREGRSFSAVAIYCATNYFGSSTGNIITNNEIYDIRGNSALLKYSGGIGHTGSKGDLIAYNSIYLKGDLDPVSEFVGKAASPAIGIYISSESGDTALKINNNSIYVDCTSDTMTLPTSYCIILPGSNYNWGSGSCNYNDYFLNSNPRGKIGATGEYPFRYYTTLAEWRTAFVPVPQDANSISADPEYSLNPQNYLIPFNSTSPLLMAAEPIAGVSEDILCEIRNPVFPTIGSYEYTETTLPVELSAFYAVVNSNDVTLNWTTASENNNSEFEIERSEVNSQLSNVWTKAGKVEGYGTITISQNYSFTDKGLPSGKYNYRLKQIDFNGNFEYFNLSSEVGIGVPTQYNLSQNYPNPFNPTTNLEFGISNLGFVSLKIYDISGKEVMTLLNEQKTPGYYSVSFNGSNLSSGIYFYTLTAGDFVSTKKMTLLK